MNAQEEFEVEMDRQNFTRAAMLAEQENLGDEAALKAQRAAIRQAIGDWFNFKGAAALAEQWDFPRSTVVEVCDELISEYETRQEREKREIQVFDIDQMDHTPVVYLMGQFRNKYR